ncbi:Mitochondrial chaperone Frataxin [Tulasnella sp. 403]|nr:Mitochondrial chaperone Frataxin [Tulasnella sp. 403]
MYRLLESLEKIVDSEEGANDWEVDYSSGVLTLKMGKHGTYVINKQPPNMQIWLSSPTSGPKRYDYSTQDSGVWFYARDGQTMHDLLQEELKCILQHNVEIGI